MAAATAIARQQPATSMMARVDRLDLLLGYLEEMHRNGHGNGNASPPSVTTASSPSTPAAGAGHRGGLVSSDDDDGDSSAASTPRGISKTTTWRRPRPAKEVLEEARTKGSLIDRIAFLEHRLLKMEEDMEITPSSANEDNNMVSQPRAKSKDDDPSSMMMMNKNKTKKKKKGLKSLVKSCVRGNLKTKD